MTETTPDVGAPRADPAELFDDSLLLLTSVRATLARLLAQLVAGDAQAMREIGPKHAELESVLRRAIETEQKYNDWHSKQAGRLAAGEIDFDRARYEIGCRLARLRACCGPG